MQVVKHLLAVLRRQSLAVQVEGVRRVFTAPDEFVAFLRARTQIRDARLQEFAGYDAHALKREARKMLHAHQNVMNVMVSAKETGEPLLVLWRHLDISKVPDDYDWPSILFALGKAPAAAEPYRHEALTLYLEFLEKRREALDKYRTPEAEAPDAQAADDARARATLRDYVRLPHGRTVEVNLTEDPDVTVFLGANRYHLSRRGGAVAFAVPDDVAPHLLKPGRNTVGRASNCDVRLPDGSRDVSREHLVVEVGTDRSVTVKDMSSRGTYMRDARFVDNHSDTHADPKSPAGR